MELLICLDKSQEKRTAFVTVLLNKPRYQIKVIALSRDIDKQNQDIMFYRIRN